MSLLYSIQQSKDLPLLDTILKRDPNKFNDSLLEGVMDSFQTLEFIKKKKDDWLVRIKKIDKKDAKDSSLTIRKSLIQRVSIEVEFKDEISGAIDSTEVVLNLPIMNQDSMFQIEGIRYVPLYNITDKSTYCIKNKLLMKNSLLPLELRKSNKGVIGIYFLKNLYNPIIFLEVKTLKTALEFYGIKSEEDLIFSDSPKNQLSQTEYFDFKLTKKVTLYVRKSEAINRNIALIIYDFLSKYKIYSRSSVFESEEFFTGLKVDTFKKKIGSAIISLKRSLDDTTKKYGLNDLHPKDKESIHHIIRYMSYFYDHLLMYDAMDLKRKRVRTNEFLLSHLTLKLSDISYRLMNTSNPLELKVLKNVFSAIHPNFIIAKLIAEGEIRPVSSSSSITLFDCLRFTHTVGALTSKSRIQNESFLGKIALMDSSAQNPGASGSLVPFLKLTEDGNFDYEIKHVTNFEEGLTYEEV